MLGSGIVRVHMLWISGQAKLICMQELGAEHICCAVACLLA
jgi:hypothetical protein